MIHKQEPSVYTIIENFYNEPERVTALAKEFPIVSCGPPKTEGLEVLDNELYQGFFQAILQLYGNVKPEKRYHLTTFFSKHTFNDIKLLNHGWWRTAGHNPYTCRYDEGAEKLVYCGIIMLSEGETDSVFQIAKVKPELEWDKQKFIDETCNYYTIPREKFLANEIDHQEFERLFNIHENNFTPVLTVANEYNKLISWRGDVVHREIRNGTILNQFFFLEEW